MKCSGKSGAVQFEYVWVLWGGWKYNLILVSKSLAIWGTDWATSARAILKKGFQSIQSKRFWLDSILEDQYRDDLELTDVLVARTFLELFYSWIEKAKCSWYVFRESFNFQGRIQQ